MVLDYMELDIMDFYPLMKEYNAINKSLLSYDARFENNVYL